MRRALRFAALLCLLGACKNLPDIRTESCGNAIVEEGEDCDLFAGAGEKCRAPGIEAQCRWDCRPQSDGSTPACPTGWGCDARGVCREPTGEFAEEGPFEVGDATALATLDFDGDGAQDLLSVDSPNSLLQARFRVHYLEGGQITESRLFPKQTTRPVVARLDSDSADDLVLSTEAIGVVRGRRDRAWVPSTFSTYRLAEGPLRIVSVSDLTVSDDPDHAEHDGAAVVVFSKVDGRQGLFVPNGESSRLGLSAPLDQPVDALVGEPLSVDLIEGTESPCREVLLAFRGDTHVGFFDMCQAHDELPLWRAKATQYRVELAGGARVDAAPLVADLNLDGHLDLLIGADGKLFFAPGDGQGLKGPAEPIQLFEPETGFTMMPLAAADVSGDDYTDFVMPTAVLTSRAGALSGAPFYGVAHINEGASWTSARIADLNGDGLLDVVAASDAGPGVTYLNGTGTQFQIATSIDARGSVPFLAVEDLDGDLVNDVAFLEHDPARPELDALKIAFGRYGSTPLAPVQVAQVASPEQLSPMHSNGMGSLLVASSERLDQQKRGILTLLPGTSDRLPFAPFELVRFAQDGNLDGYAALSLSVGAFRRSGAQDLVALATPYFGDQPQMSFWLVPEIGSGTEAPLQLEGALPASFEPATAEPTRLRVQVASASADLDRDGLDEALWSMPADGGQRCGLFVLKVDPDLSLAKLSRKSSLLLDLPCLAPTLAVRDLDRDGFPDVMLGLGEDDAGELRVLWNDRAGNFDVDDATSIDAEGGMVRAFAAFDEKRTRVAFVTAGALWLSEGSLDARGFLEPRRISRLNQAKAVTVADLDGDGLQDIAASDASGLWFWKARVK